MSTAVDDSAPRLRGLDLLRAIAEGTAAEVGDEFLRGLVRHLSDAFRAQWVFVGESDPEGAHVKVVAGCFAGAPMEAGFEYDSEGLPCALTVEQAVVAYPRALADHFPADIPALQMGMQSYLAVCLRAADGTHLGHLALLDGRPMEASDEDVAALQIFAARAAAELERRRQAAALEASRTRAIEAADAERRRIGRDLHDGAQQRLVAIANLLTVARKKTGDPVLELAADELTAANTELRELARGLYPVALAERGLKDAVESLAGTCATPVTVDIRDAAVPERAALAAYFVVSESLTNVARYAQASSARVRGSLEDGTLRIDVEDDGIGGADPTAGTGLRGLVDRLEILGGTLEVVSPPGAGTRITATIPAH
jgi:signal transduction histidine kinase